jgi:hypothetical protein
MVPLQEEENRLREELRQEWEGKQEKIKSERERHTHMHSHADTHTAVVFSSHIHS